MKIIVLQTTGAMLDPDKHTITFEFTPEDFAFAVGHGIRPINRVTISPTRFNNNLPRPYTIDIDPPADPPEVNLSQDHAKIKPADGKTMLILASCYGDFALWARLNLIPPWDRRFVYVDNVIDLRGYDKTSAELLLLPDFTLNPAYTRALHDELRLLDLETREAE